MDDAPASATASPRRVGPGFIAALTLAYIGGFIGFVPLLSLIVPLQAQELSPNDKVGLLSLVSLSGAMTASVANLAAGWASDRTRSRFGRRRPWIGLGLTGVVAAYGVIAWAPTPYALVAGVVAFQLAFNLMFAPLNAVLADVVPDVQKGRVAAFLGLGPPMGAASGLLIALPQLGGATSRLALLAALIVVCILPLLLTWRERPWSPPSPAAQAADAVKPPLSADFGFTWASRFLMQIAASVVNAYMLFYLADYALYGERFPGSTVESGLARLIAFSTLLIVLSGFIGGLASDRYRRRRLFIVLSAVLVAAGLALFAVWPQWPGPLIAYAFYGVGLGLYTTVDVALVAQVLPSRRHTARDLGIMNLTNTLPAVLAPLLALVALGADRQGWPALMGISAAIAVAGGFTVLGVRRVR